MKFGAIGILTYCHVQCVIYLWFLTSPIGISKVNPKLPQALRSGLMQLHSEFMITCVLPAMGMWTGLKQTNTHNREVISHSQSPAVRAMTLICV